MRKGQICSDQKGQTVPTQLKVAKHSWLHISISIWQSFSDSDLSEIPRCGYTFIIFKLRECFCALSP